MTITELSSRYVERRAELDPIAATSWGVAGHDAELPDLSPDGLEERADLDRRTLVELRDLPAEGDVDRRAAALMTERLDLALELHEAGEGLRALRVIGSPVQSVRQVFDLMPKATEDDWRVIAERMSKVPEALAGVRASLEAGRGRGILAARRQALACAGQAETWGGPDGFFLGMAAGHPDLDGPAQAATGAYAGLAQYLREEYAPTAPERDAVGRDRYSLWFRSSHGAELDLDEAYAWGWDELHRIESEMRAEADRVVPGGSIEDAVGQLEGPDGPAIEGVDALRDWLQALMDRTVDELDGAHFDIPEPVRRVEAMIAPPGGAAAMYYTGPSEDFSRPGRTWYPTLGKTRFPTWGEVSIAYHEGVPGHHLQVAQVRHLGEALPRFSRLTFVSAHGEGWALYAERLMDELGYLTDPGERLGMLRAQAMRAVRVVVDIGMHLELAIPPGEPGAGETWTPERGLVFVLARSRFPADFMASEIDRYLGWHGQAPSYKLGERAWLAARAEVQARDGSGFDLKAFHARALDLGPLGLDQLRSELVRV
ncbi:MAG: DUF885 domain-containing protein [Acidimicrobiia bacterium]|nr:DUF885 domain-containing protein [Acidimicrobiia bacterium]